MKETWNYELMDLVKEAKWENSNERLIEFLNKFPSLAVANEDHSVLVVLRHFHVHHWDGNKMVMNTHPKAEHFQWGITLVNFSEGSSGSSNLYLPNTRNYTGLKIQEKEIEIFSDDNSVVKTNVLELSRKMRFFGDFKEEDLEVAFNSLCNEEYPKKKLKQPKVKVLKLSSIGELSYKEEFEWYEGKIKINDALVDLNIYHCSPKKLENLLSFVSKQIQLEFHEEMLLKMEKDMLALKNDSWLGEEEQPMLLEAFRKRISIESIVFHQDCSAIIYCKDDDIFLGHSIAINIDEKGNYEDSNLVG